jgi:hypothetical protein
MAVSYEELKQYPVHPCADNTWFICKGEHRQNVHAGGDFKKAFQYLFPGTDVPAEVGVSCCALFAATRDKIRERKREEYARWRQWLMDTELDDNISGRVMEYSWHSKRHDLFRQGRWSSKHWAGKMTVQTLGLDDILEGGINFCSSRDRYAYCMCDNWRCTSRIEFLTRRNRHVDC